MHMDFYQGRILRIDLSSGTTRVEPLQMEWARLYIGGKGLLFRYLLDEVDPGIDPLSERSPLMFFTGPFAGTGVTTCSRLVVGCKSPATGTILDSYVGGSFGPELKSAGYDGLILTGRAARPTLVWINDDVVELRPAESYMGMGIADLEERLRKDLDTKARFMSNGPAGENLLPWACLSTDQYHKAGRGGAGALMGSKNVKSVAVRGTGSVSVGDVPAFLKDLRRMHRDYIFTPANMWAHEEGTLALVDMVQMAGAMPTRNWSQGQFEAIDNINSRAYMAMRLKKRACSQCALGCRNFHVFGDARGEGPEFETVAHGDDFVAPSASPPCRASSATTMATDRTAAWTATHRSAGSLRQQPRDAEGLDGHMTNDQEVPALLFDHCPDGRESALWGYWHMTDCPMPRPF